MARINLKNVLRKKSEAAFSLATFIGQLEEDLWIEDEKGNLLLGTVQPNKLFQFPIAVESEMLGWVYGNADSKLVADLLTYLSEKEAEKKRLGTEVLNLYQEINLIFNFSEKLAKTIDAPAICAITLTEASHVIKADNGVVVLWDEVSKQLQVMAASGEQFFNKETINQQIAFLSKIIISGLSEIITDTSELVETGIVSSHVQSIIYSALKVKHRVMGAIILASNDPVPYTAADLKLLTTLALQASGSIESALLYEQNIREANEREEALRRVYEATAKFVPYEFIQSLGHRVITDIKLGDHVEKLVTVLFSDIRDYTTLSEQLTPEENFRFVCSFNERMGPVIRKNNGFINQYLGDAIMAIFPGNASEALQAAVEMQLILEGMNMERRQQNQRPIQIGIGMHTGPLIMGITGDYSRLDAATISDTVNTSSRLESLTKYYKAGIVISDASYRQMPNAKDFHLRYLGLVQLKGKQERIGVYECFSANNKEELEKKETTLLLFDEGVSHYLNRSFEKAKKSFEQVIDIHPNDRTAQFFSSKAEQLISAEGADEWTGVIEMHEK